MRATVRTPLALSLALAWTVIFPGPSTLVGAQSISLADIPSINSSVITNYVKARSDYIASEKEIRQGESSASSCWHT
jgi:hypothetical protein